MAIGDGLSSSNLVGSMDELSTVLVIYIFDDLLAATVYRLKKKCSSLRICMFQETGTLTVVPCIV